MDDPSAARLRAGGFARNGDGRAGDLAALLAARPDARLLDAGADTLALILPRFEAVTATTIGAAALVSDRGAYGQPRRAGEPFAAPPGRIALRLAPGRGERLVHVPAVPERSLPAALRLFDAEGRLAHRARLGAPADAALLAALLAEIPDGPLPLAPEAPVASPPASLSAIRRARESWPEAEETAHLDDLLRDGGRTRRACLPHLGPAARRIDPGVIGPLLAHLARARRPFRRIVARPGCLQLHEGPLDGFRYQGERVLLRAERSLVALDLSRIASAWVTRIDRGRETGRAFELYDGEGFAAAAFLAPGAADPRRDAGWESLLASLPGAPAAAPEARRPLIRRLAARPAGAGPRLVASRDG